MRQHLSLVAICMFLCISTITLLSCTDAGVDIYAPPTPPQTVEVSFSKDIQPIFNGNGCVSCHGGNGGLFLTPGDSYNNLVNINAQTACSNKERVLPGNADQSVLYIRVSGETPDTECGPNSRMPLGSTRLPQATIELIRKWINQGAKNN